MDGSVSEKKSFRFWSLFLLKCASLKPVSLTDTMSSIKAMFGLINHDAAPLLSGSCLVTCPIQLLFTFLW